MKPLISIIVPVYNVSDYIEECLNSLIHQTLKEIEIIVVDDCGIDDSIAKAEKIAKTDSRIHILHNPKNMGLAEARNVGLRVVKTPYVAFLDSDDWVNLQYCEILYNDITRYDADIAIGSTSNFENGQLSKSWSDIWNYTPRKKVITELVDKQYNMYACSCCNRLFKFSLFDKTHFQFPTGLKIEDVPVSFIATALAKKVVLNDEAKMFYRRHSDSIMAQSSINRTSFDIFKIYDYTTYHMERLLSKDKDFKSYQQMLDHFKVFNIYAWYKGTPEIYKPEFFGRMRMVFQHIDMRHNLFFTNESKEIYNVVVHNEHLIYRLDIKLFDTFPIFKIVKTNKKLAWYLFRFIPLFKLTRKADL